MIFKTSPVQVPVIHITIELPNMRKDPLEFFARPEEQATWLKKIVSTDDIWCVKYKLRQGEYEYPTVEENINKNELIGGDNLNIMFFLGNAKLIQEPVWKTGKRGLKEFDFIKSQAVQFSASIDLNQSFIRGQIAVMTSGWYLDNQIEPYPIFHFYDNLVRSFRALKAKNQKVYLSGRLRPNLLVTSGVIEEYRAGKALKQSPNASVCYEIDPRK